MQHTTLKLSLQQQDTLLATLKLRFQKNPNRHKGIEWKNVQEKLESNTNHLHSLYLMEETGGEPDVVEYDKKTDLYTFYDCSPESPAGRRSLCYDDEALQSRKEHKPKNSAIEIASQMGIQILTEEQYRNLQKLGKFDNKTSSWVKTPPNIRELGGAVFCDFRFNTVFLYHNGAESYYAARGFRGSLQI